MSRRHGCSPSSVKIGAAGSLSARLGAKEGDALDVEHSVAHAQLRGFTLAVREPQRLAVEVTAIAARKLGRARTGELNPRKNAAAPVVAAAMSALRCAASRNTAVSPSSSTSSVQGL